MRYLQERREALGGYLPARSVPRSPLRRRRSICSRNRSPVRSGREVSTTMAFVRVLTLLLKDQHLGRYIVPIIPDEARTFGMESLFRQYGIYASQRPALQAVR